MAIVYQHKTEDEDKIFYIGIGKNIKRAYDFNKRSKFYKRIVKKHGVVVEILYENIKWEMACEIEKELIKLYGRRDIGNGILVNMTDGGEGNTHFSDEIELIRRRKISESKTDKKQSEATKRKLSIFYTGKTWENRFGILRANEIKEKMRKKTIGQKRPKQSVAMKGKKSGFEGKKHSEEFKEQRRQYFLSDKNPGKNKSEETKVKMSKGHIGKISQFKGVSRKKLICPHCGKEGGEGLMQRWHFDNCKFKINN